VNGRSPWSSVDEIDNAIPPTVAYGLNEAGYDAIHVRDIGLQSASDRIILKHAQNERMVVVTCDTDFSQILALWRSTLPSLNIFRMKATRDPYGQLDLLKANLSGPVSQALQDGSVAIIEESRIRVRKLPIQ